jgi:polysaccharide biosynthesis PFTS motif protein
MRGNSFNKRNSGFVALRKIHNDLIAIPLGEKQAGAEWFYGASASKAELIVRQFIFDRYGGGRLNKILLEYLGCKKPIGSGLPLAWRSYLEGQGWLLNRFASGVAWQAIVIMRFAHGVLYLGKLCAKLALAPRVIPNGKPYAYLEGLSLANLPASRGCKDSRDICTFYARWDAKSPNVRFIYHDVVGATERATQGMHVSYLPHVHELAGGVGCALKLAWWGCWATVLAALQMVVGRWYWALMLGEAAKAKATRLVPKNLLASEYLFHVSRTIYRPMWTYDVEKAGAAVAVYFYSTYVQPKLASGYESQNFEWGPNTWPRFIVWDRYQEERMRKDLGDMVDITQAGPIYFSDSGRPVPDLPANSIAIFDIQPHRSSAHFGISTMADCLADYPDFYHRFLDDVTEVIREAGAVTVLKTKREIDSRGDKRYGRILKRLEQDDLVFIVDPGLSALRLAECCNAGVSAPFTSAAIYFRELGKPSVYYDPVGWTQADDCGAHGIPVLRGKSALRDWVANVLNPDTSREMG